MDWTSIIQTAVAVIGFGAVIYQLGLVERSLRSTTRSSIYDLASTVKQTIIENPHLSPYFYNSKEISPNDNNYDNVMAMADLFCLYLEKIATQSEAIDKDNREAWAIYIKDVYDQCPSIQHYLKGKENWYSHELRKTLNL